MWLGVQLSNNEGVVCNKAIEAFRYFQFTLVYCVVSIQVCLVCVVHVCVCMCNGLHVFSVKFMGESMNSSNIRLVFEGTMIHGCAIKLT